MKVYILRSGRDLYAYASRAAALQELADSVREEVQHAPASAEGDRLLRLCDNPLRHAELNELFWKFHAARNPKSDYVLDVTELEVVE